MNGAGNLRGGLRVYKWQATIMHTGDSVWETQA